MSVVFDVVVLGAGAAGLLAAARLAERGRDVLLLEKNRKAGVKILMSGGTRCNLTHAIDNRGIIEAFGERGRFLHSPIAALPPAALIELIEAEGVKTKVESTCKVFPASDKATDVLDALLRRLSRSGAMLALDEPVLDLRLAGNMFHTVTARRTIQSTTVVLTTGGQSYPGCGTTGDGYAWLKRLGHTIVTPRPALTPIKTRADWAKSLRGVAAADVRVGVRQVGPSTTGLLVQRRGGLMFAHFGLSGPAVLDVSGFVTRHPRPRSLELVCDFLPDTTSQLLADRFQEFAVTLGRKQVAVLLSERLPRRLADALVQQADLPADRRAAELTRHERARLVAVIKQTRIPITGTLGFDRAEVTAGGVSLDEIDSRTMQSKRVPNLFVAGEILDLDGPIGGYNFQAAFSTGWLAAQSVSGSPL